MADRHAWDNLRAMPTCRNREHESLYRSYHVLKNIKAMLERGDSPDTVRYFIEWAEHNPVETELRAPDA